MADAKTIDGVAFERTEAGGHRLPDDVYDSQWLERVLDFTAKGADGCWLWLGNKTRNGYGQVAYRGKSKITHRKVYEVVHGVKIDRWIYVCHRCDVKLCINPEHLWLGTPKENIHDSVNKGRHAELRKTHCDRGHPLSGDNLRLRLQGKGKTSRLARVCKTCERERR